MVIVVVHLLAASVLPHFAIDLDFILVAVHEIYVRFLLLETKLFVKCLYTCMFGDSVAHAPSVYLPRLSAFVRMLFEHPRVWREVGHDRDLAMPREETGAEEELEWPQ